MGWSPISPGALRIVVGLLLLANPFVVAEFDVGDPDRYRYEAFEVGFDEDGIDVPIEAGDLDPDVACFEQIPGRACMLERAIHEHGGLTYDGLPEPFVRADYRYVYDYGEGFFEPVAEERNDTVRYDLEPVSREEAMDGAATDLERASPAIRTAVESGEVESSDELPGADELVDAGDGYYVAHAVEYRETTGERRAVVVALQWLLGIVGLGLVLHGQRLRVERRSV